MNAAERRARQLAGWLYPLARCPLLTPTEYASLRDVSERRARTILARLGTEGLAGEVCVPGRRPGRPARLAYLTAHGVTALAEATGTTAEVLVKRCALGEGSLVARLGQLDRLVPARGVLIALSRALPDISGALRDWRGGPVRWPTPDGQGHALTLDGEGVVRLPAGVWRVALLWDGDAEIPPTVLAARLARLVNLDNCYRNQDRDRDTPRVRVPSVLVVTAAAARIPNGYQPGVLWTTTDDLAAFGVLGAPWRGGRGAGEARPFAAALEGQATTRSYATPSALRHAVGRGVPPGPGERLASQVARVRVRLDPDASLALVSAALPSGAAALLDVVCRHPLLAAAEIAVAADRPPGCVRAGLAALDRYGLLVTEPVARARAQGYVATARSLRLRALAAGIDPATYARATGALAEAGRTASGGASRLRFLRATPGHTRGVNAAYLAFLRATRATGGTLVWWGEWACVRTFEDAGRLETLRPDAYGEVALPRGRLSFYLEVDCGTTPAWRLGNKLARYERYRLCADTPPFVVLLVLPGEGRAVDVLAAFDAAQSARWEPSRLDVRSTTATALMTLGPLAGIWCDGTGRRVSAFTASARVEIGGAG